MATTVMMLVANPQVTVDWAKGHYWRFRDRLNNSKAAQEGGALYGAQVWYKSLEEQWVGAVERALASIDTAVDFCHERCMSHQEEESLLRNMPSEEKLQRWAKDLQQRQAEVADGAALMLRFLVGVMVDLSAAVVEASRKHAAAHNSGRPPNARGCGENVAARNRSVDQDVVEGEDETFLLVDREAEEKWNNVSHDEAKDDDDSAKSDCSPVVVEREMKDASEMAIVSKKEENDDVKDDDEFSVMEEEKQSLLAEKESWTGRVTAPASPAEDHNNADEQLREDSVVVVAAPPAAVSNTAQEDDVDSDDDDWTVEEAAEQSLTASRGEEEEWVSMEGDAVEGDSLQEKHNDTEVLAPRTVSKANSDDWDLVDDE